MIYYILYIVIYIRKENKKKREKKKTCFVLFCFWRVFVSAGNLANLLTIKRLEPLEPLDPGAVFALRVLVWCTLVGCEFNDESRDTLSVSKQGDESLPVEYSVRWSSDADHTAIVSNNRNDPSTEFKFMGLKRKRRVCDTRA